MPIDTISDVLNHAVQIPARGPLMKSADAYKSRIGELYSVLCTDSASSKREPAWVLKNREHITKMLGLEKRETQRDAILKNPEAIIEELHALGVLYAEAAHSYAQSFARIPNANTIMNFSPLAEKDGSIPDNSTVTSRLNSVMAALSAKHSYGHLVPQAPARKVAP